MYYFILSFILRIVKHFYTSGADFYRFITNARAFLAPFRPLPPPASGGRRTHKRAADRRQRVANVSARGEFVYQKRNGKQRTDSGQWVRTAVSRIQFPQKRFPRRKLSFAAAACRGCKQRSAKALPSTEKDRKNGHLNNKEVQKLPPATTRGAQKRSPENKGKYLSPSQAGVFKIADYFTEYSLQAST